MMGRRKVNGNVAVPADTPDEEWPIGMKPDGTLRTFAPPPSLTDEELGEWLDDQEDDFDGEN